jgi:Heparinase II/III-like protein
LLFRRVDLAAKARRLDAQTRTLFGPEAPEAFARLLAQPDAHFAPVRAFPDSGYYLLGSDFETSREARVLIDAGPLGYLSLAAHGHADALAVLLNLGGREILVDPGTYAYHTEPEWRRYFRGTSAHNTVVVDGLDQSEQRGNFMWSNHAHARCLEFSSGLGTQCFRGEHHGYRRLRDPVTHRRDLEYRHGEAALLISDTLDCAGPHEVTRRWQIGQGLQLVRQGDAVHLDAGVAVVTLEPLEPLREVTVHNAGNASEGGWISRRFGHKEPCWSVSWHSRVEGTTTLKTRITWRWR